MLYFFKINFFLRQCYIPVFPVIAMQRFDFKNSIIAIKLYLVMISNLYLTSEWSKSKSDFVVAVLQRGHRKPIFHKLVWFFRVFLKWSQWSCKTTHFLPCQKQLCSQRLVSLHFSLHANELCSPRPSLLWKSKGDSQIIIKNIKCETYLFWRCSWIMNFTDPSLSFNFLTKPALNCPSFRKQSGPVSQT